MKYFWAYAVTGRSVTLVRCQSRDTVEIESNSLLLSDANLVGITTSAITEGKIRSVCRSNGWRVDAVRDY